MKRKLFYSTLFFTALFINHAAPLQAHGTKYEVITKGVIAIKAMYDTGDPMARATVLAFEPGKTQSSFTAHTDEKGVFFFVPDKPGTWIFQVKDRIGHGLRVNLKVDQAMAVTDSKGKKGGVILSGTTPAQKIIMALCVVWGFIGTGFYFKSRGKKES